MQKTHPASRASIAGSGKAPDSALERLRPPSRAARFARFLRSTTFRLSLTFVVCFSLTAVLSIGYIYYRTQIILQYQLQETIEAEIRGLAEQYSSGGIRRLAETVAKRSSAPGTRLYMLADESGRLLAGNVSALRPEVWNAIGRTEFLYSDPDGDERLALASVFRLPDDTRLLVGRDIEDRRIYQRLVGATVAWTLAVMVLVGVIVGWGTGRNILRRVDQATLISRSIMRGHMNRRLPIAGSGDELDRLAENLNLMLERIEKLMNGLKEVSDNIAHDLKTPLTRMRQRLESAIQSGDQDTYRETIEAALEETDDLISTFNMLLSIARLEAGSTELAMDDLELGDLVQDVLELYEPLAEDEEVVLKAGHMEPVTVRGARNLIFQALANLVDNALKYGAAPASERKPGETPEVVVDVRVKGNEAEVRVMDCGTGIAPADRERVLQRFVRLDTSRSRPGTGLGLNLVLAIARFHGGTLRLEDGEPGLRAVLQLPVAGPPPRRHLLEMYEE
ncbi:sensor histidine kinase [Afifella pfennigii]|uniref:sensor histidine kinase n=1 Tax=Afifella pfennigii TaxID=209897 RepID=UPI00068B6A87|nr:HAMP domain-containing sensor histidine kinase [Afifella pfennigii]